MSGNSEIAGHLTGSPCCMTGMELGAMFGAYAGIGLRRFEVFTNDWPAGFPPDGDPEELLALARPHGISFSSLHLPPVIADDVPATMARAVGAARLASRIGAPVVLFKADSRETYVRAAGEFLDAADDLGLTAVVQNHFGTPLTTLADVREVLDGIDDGRMKALLEVGHFHAAGVKWPEAYEALAGRIALVHIKDQVGRQSVPFGKGEIDLPGLFRRLAGDGYAGDIVVEMEVVDHENTLRYLAEAVDYILREWPAAAPVAPSREEA